MKNVDLTPITLFLLGAGASIPSGMPTTDEITQAVLNSTKFGKHSSGAILYPVKPDRFDQLKQAEIAVRQRYLRHLSQHAKPYGSDSCTYEDVYYVERAIFEELTGEASDPPARLLWEKVEATLDEDVLAAIREDWPTWLPETDRFLRGAVAAFIDRPEVPAVPPMAFIGEAHSDPDVQRLLLFTTNHDVVLETYLRSQRIPFIDGFGQPDGDLSWFDISNYTLSVGETLLYKLHGSVDWFDWGAGGGTRPRLGRGRQEIAKDASGVSYLQIDPNPRILLGTLNKAEEYQWRPFPLLVSAFVEALGRADAIVVCGHSLGDRVLRGHLANWLHPGQARRIVLVDPCASQIADRLRMTVFDGRLRPVDIGIEEARWVSVKELLAS